MYKNDKTSDEQNFWISYADLMAGLLFVFILLVGAIVVRYVFVQQDLAEKKMALGQSKSALSESENALSKSKNALSSQNEKVLLFQERLKEAANNLEKNAVDKKSLEELLTLKGNDIVKLKELLMGHELKSTSLESNLAESQSKLLNSQDALTQSQSELTMAQSKLTDNQNILILKDEELAVLGAKLLQDSKAHQLLVDELNITKVKIKNLTGIRINVVNQLRNTLGSSIMIDAKSGAIRFSSNILFNKGDYRLKIGAKQELSAIIKKYIHTLLFDDEIRRYIDNITIEGHTDTDGSYLYNLALSQKRALEVMKFLYQDDPDNRALYARYLSASGRSYSDLIANEFGDEDKDASRRIEIKFRIKNEQAAKELENFLNK